MARKKPTATEEQAVVPSENTVEVDTLACYVGVPGDIVNRIEQREDTCNQVEAASRAMRVAHWRDTRDDLAPYGQFKQWCADHSENYNTVMVALERTYGERRKANELSYKRTTERQLSAPEPESAAQTPLDDVSPCALLLLGWLPSDLLAEATPLSKTERKRISDRVVWYNKARSCESSHGQAALPPPPGDVDVLPPEQSQAYADMSCFVAAGRHSGPSTGGAVGTAGNAAWPTPPCPTVLPGWCGRRVGHPQGYLAA